MVSGAATLIPLTSVLPMSVTVTSQNPRVDVGIEASISIGGGEALGLAVDADHVWAVSFQNSSLVAVDPELNEVVATVELDDGAASALAVDGHVWVVAYAMAGGSSLTRVDAATASVTGTFPTADELCCDMAFGDGALWAIDPNGAALRFGVESGERTGRFDIEIDSNAHVNGVFADGSFWYSSDTTPLSRLDPDSGMIETFDVGGGVPFLARDGLIWGASPTDVWAADERTGEIVERTVIADSIEVMALEVTDHHVFVGMRHPGYRGAVLQLDRATGVVVTEIAVDIPARMAIGFGSLWVTDSGSDLLLRIGPVEI